MNNTIKRRPRRRLTVIKKKKYCQFPTYLPCLFIGDGWAGLTKENNNLVEVISNLKQPSTEKNTIQDFNSPHYKKREFTSHLISDASLSFFTRTMNRLKPRCLQHNCRCRNFHLSLFYIYIFFTLFQLISKLSHDTNFYISHLNLHLIKTLLFCACKILSFFLQIFQIYFNLYHFTSHILLLPLHLSINIYSFQIFFTFKITFKN